MYSGPLRLVRALIVSATYVALSLAAHILGSGSGTPMVSVVDVVGLLMTTVLMTLVLVALSGRRWDRRADAMARGRADPDPGPGLSQVGGATGRGGRFARWQRPRILTDVVVLQCLSRRGPPALAS